MVAWPCSPCWASLYKPLSLERALCKTCWVSHDLPEHCGDHVWMLLILLMHKHVYYYCSIILVDLLADSLC